MQRGRRRPQCGQRPAVLRADRPAARAGHLRLRAGPRATDGAHAVPPAGQASQPLDDHRRRRVVEHDAVHAAPAAPDGRPGHHAAQRPRADADLRARSGIPAVRPVRPQPRRADDQRRRWRGGGVRRAPHAPGVAAACGIPDDVRRQVPQRVRRAGRADARPARVEQLARDRRPVDVQLREADREQQRDAPHLRPVQHLGHQRHLEPAARAASDAAQALVHVGELRGAAHRRRRRPRTIRRRSTRTTRTPSRPPLPRSATRGRSPGSG